jgi:hypothetical protein
MLKRLFHFILAPLDAIFYPNEDSKYVFRLFFFRLISFGIAISFFILSFQSDNRNTFIILLLVPFLYYCLFQGLSGVFHSFIYPGDYLREGSISVRGKLARPLGYIYLLGFFATILVLLWVIGILK